MMSIRVLGCGVILWLSFTGQIALGATASCEAAASLPSETPMAFQPRVASFDYVERDVMIPMRDGVKLKTVMLIPRGATRAPILLSRIANRSPT